MEPRQSQLGETLSRQDMRAMLDMVRAATLMENQLDAELRDADVRLRTNEWDALVHLAARGPLRPSELLRMTTLCVSPGTLHGVLARLEERGLVAREPHPDNGRAVLHRVTDDGLALVERWLPTFSRRVVGRFAASFTDEEMDQLAELASRI